MKMKTKKHFSLSLLTTPKIKLPMTQNPRLNISNVQNPPKRTRNLSFFSKKKNKERKKSKPQIQCRQCKVSNSTRNPRIHNPNQTKPYKTGPLLLFFHAPITQINFQRRNSPKDLSFRDSKLTVGKVLLV